MRCSRRARCPGRHQAQPGSVQSGLLVRIKMRADWRDISRCLAAANRGTESDSRHNGRHVEDLCAHELQLIFTLILSPIYISPR